MSTTDTTKPTKQPDCVRRGTCSTCGADCTIDPLNPQLSLCTLCANESPRG